MSPKNPYIPLSISSEVAGGLSPGGYTPGFGGFFPEQSASNYPGIKELEIYRVSKINFFILKQVVYTKSYSKIVTDSAIFSELNFISIALKRVVKCCD